MIVYAAVAAGWILASDMVSRAMTIDPDMLTTVAIAKGALFVAVTSGLLFLQIRNDFAHLQASGTRLSESERRFRSVIDCSPVPMTVIDEDGNITWTNAAYLEMVGYTRDDVPTLSDWWSKAYPDAIYRQRMADAWFAELERSREAREAFVPIEARIRCKDGAERTMLVSSAPVGGASAEQVVVFYDITERERAEEAVFQSNERLGSVLKSVIALIGRVVEVRDPYTQGHEEGVARISRMIAEEMGLPEDLAAGVEVAALVHDVGKLGVPAEILTKPGSLSESEFALIRQHSRGGYDILQGIDFDWPVADIVLQHHERMDGTGYPGALAADDISVSARILMVADVVEAMAAHRPYRAALGLDAAMAELTEHPEKYDAAVVAACVRLRDAGRIEV